MSDDNNESYHCLFYDEIFQINQKIFLSKMECTATRSKPLG